MSTIVGLSENQSLARQPPVTFPDGRHGGGTAVETTATAFYELKETPRGSFSNRARKFIVKHIITQPKGRVFSSSGYWRNLPCVLSCRYDKSKSILVDNGLGLHRYSLRIGFFRH